MTHDVVQYGYELTCEASKHDSVKFSFLSLFFNVPSSSNAVSSFDVYCILFYFVNSIDISAWKRAALIIVKSSVPCLSWASQAKVRFMLVFRLEEGSASRPSFVPIHAQA
jgi:hypothetical protein